MIRLILSIAILFCTTTINFAQKNKAIAERAIVNTYDGSTFIGKIIAEDDMNMTVIVVTQDTININKGFIKRIRRSDKNISIVSGGKFHFTKGPFYSLQWGAGGSENGDATNQFDFIVGYRFNQKIAAGLGVGSHINSTFFRGIWAENTFVPVYAYGRYYPFDKKVRPFVSGKLGWGFADENAFGDDHTGGVMFQPSIGLNFASRKNSRFILSLSQIIQNTKGDSFNQDQFGNPIIANYSLWYNRTILTLAIEWK